MYDKNLFYILFIFELSVQTCVSEFLFMFFHIISRIIRIFKKAHDLISPKIFSIEKKDNSLNFQYGSVHEYTNR